MSSIRPVNTGSLSPAVPFCTFKVYNTTGRYDPWNAAGPLYGNLVSGRKVRIKVKNGTAGDNEPVFTGRIDDIKPYGRRNTVTFVVKGGWELLNNAEARAAIQQGITADTAIGDILDYVNWPTIWGRALDTAPETINYWWAPKVKAKNEIESLTESGMGYVFCARDGKLTYYSRHRTDAPVTILTEDELLKDITITQPWEFQRNIINVQSQPRVLQASQDIWTLNEKPALNAGESYEVWPTYTYENKKVPAIDVIEPATVTDFAGNAQADGGGADLTADFLITYFYDFGETAKIIIKNNGLTDGFLTLLKVRGKPIDSPDTAGKSDTGADYDTDPKVFNVDLVWLQDTGVAQDMATFLAGFLSAGPEFPAGFVEDRFAIQFGLELFDRVTLTLATWGVDKDYRLSKITHKWLEPTGQLIRTGFKFEPAFDNGADVVWILGVSLLGTQTYLGW